MVAYMQWNSARAWLSRLTFSFFILAGFLAWEIYRVLTGRAAAVPTWQLALYFVAGAMSVALGLAGLRVRHQRADSSDDRFEN